MTKFLTFARESSGQTSAHVQTSEADEALEETKGSKQNRQNQNLKEGIGAEELFRKHHQHLDELIARMVDPVKVPRTHVCYRFLSQSSSHFGSSGRETGVRQTHIMSRPPRNRADEGNANHPPTLSRAHPRPTSSQPLGPRSRQPSRIHWQGREQISRNEGLPYARYSGPDTPTWMQLRDLSSSLPPPRPVSGPSREMIRRPSAPEPPSSQRQGRVSGAGTVERMVGRHESRRRSIDAAIAIRQDTRVTQAQRYQSRSENRRVDTIYHREEVTTLRRRFFGAPEYEVRRFDATTIRRNGGDESRQVVGARQVRDRPDDQWSTTATVGGGGRGRVSRRGSPGPERQDERRGRGERRSSRRR